MVAVVVLVNVLSGGMRSITFVQAFQYWLKLTALLVPAVVLLVVWSTTARRPGDAGHGGDSASPGRCRWATGGAQGLYPTYSLMVATFLGTMGLPHVVVRFYTNPDGRAARRTTLVVLALLGIFYLLPPVYAALGRVYGDSGALATSVVLELPRLMLGGLGGDLLTALVTAGAFAAFLSTSSGLSIAVAGVISQDVLGRRAARRAHRRSGSAAVVAVVRTVRCCAAGHRTSASPDGRGPGLRGGRVDVLPAAGAGHLVARPDRRRRDRRAAVGGSARARRGAGRPASTHRTGGWFAVLLGQPAAWSRAAGVRHHGRRLAGRPAHRCPAHVAAVHGPAAHPRGRALDRG